MSALLNSHSPPQVLPRVPPMWRRFRQAAAIAAAAAVLLPVLLPADGPDQEESKCGPCIASAKLMYSSALSEATASSQSSLARANNEPTPAVRAAGKRLAAEEYKAARDLAREQLRERRDLCLELNESRYNPVINPADFLSVAEVAAAPNPLFPLVPGTTYNFRSTSPEGTETVEFAVTRQTRSILGVTCIVVRDVVRKDGSVIEDTVDWFAQDRAGNVWYFGENTAEFVAGLITSIAGSWEAGVGGARPGIVMFARPVVGKVYRQELLYGEAEDAAEVLALDALITVPAGTYSHCLQTEDFTPLEPDSSELKYYAPGIGNVLTLKVETGKRVELISIVHN